MLVALFLSRALLLAAPAAGAATLIMREGDDISSDAVETLVSQAPEFTFWSPTPDAIDAAAAKLHLTPYYLVEGAERQALDAQVKSLLEAAQKKSPLDQPAAIHDALTLALHLPPLPPDPRNQKVLLAQKRLVDAYLRVGADGQAASLIEEYVTRQPLDVPIELGSKAQPLVTRARRQAHAELSVEVANADAVGLSLDGQDFTALRAEKLLPGVHEVVVRLGPKLTGLMHRVDVSAKTMRLVLDAELERGLVFTPKGFLLRRTAKLTPSVAAFVAGGTNVSSVWLVEKKSEVPPALLVTVSQDGKAHAAQVNLRKDAPLRPLDVDGRKNVARAIVAAGRVALAEQPLLIGGYETVRGPEGLLTLFAHEEDEGSPLYKKWWLWTAVGAVVAAGAATTAILVATHESGFIFNPTVTTIAR